MLRTRYRYGVGCWREYLNLFINYSLVFSFSEKKLRAAANEKQRIATKIRRCEEESKIMEDNLQ
jgi:hypothetical protein